MFNMSPSDLADRRKELGLTQQGLAELLGIAVSTVARWESKTPPQYPPFLELALDHLHCVNTSKTELPAPQGLSDEETKDLVKELFSKPID